MLTRLQEVGGDAAEDLAAELPGLIVVQDGKACVTDPRAHDILLEKVPSCNVMFSQPAMPA